MTTRLKLLLTGLGALAVVLVVVLVWSITRPPPSAVTPLVSGTPADPSAVSSGEATFNPSAGDASDDHAHDPDLDAEAAWRPVVENFARNFTNTTGGDQAWQARLTEDRDPSSVTDAVTQQLRTVDVRNVPDGHYEDYQAVKASAYDVAVKVNYTEGWSMVLYLVTDGTHWQVYAYDRWEE